MAIIQNLLLLSIVLVFFSGKPAKHPRPNKDYALFFAVSTYQDDGLTNLPNTIKNTQDIAKVLEESYGFQTEVVSNPTLDEIDRKLTEYKNKFANGTFAKDGQLFLFFTGHGVREYGNGYFLPSDADEDNLRRTAFQYNTWRPFISAMDCQHILVAVDACYSVTFDPDWQTMTDPKFQRIGELSEADRILANHKEYKNRIFFTSDAKEDVVPGRSNFARKFLEGLEAYRYQGSFATSSELFANYIQKAQPSPRANDFEGDDPRSSFLFFPVQQRKVDAQSFTQRQQDINAYEAIRQNPTLTSCQQYLQDFPQGAFRTEVNALVIELQEEQEWKFVTLKDSKEAYQNYLRLYPNGRYSAQARQKTDASTATVELPDMVFIQGGTFEMGDVWGDGRSDEKPVHTVTLSDYYLGRTEVTVEEFAKFIQSTDYKTDADKADGSYIWTGSNWERKAGVNWKYNTEDKIRSAGEYRHPVIHVSWYDAINYCNWRSKQENLQPVYSINGINITADWKANGYRLPTEAEWEYAARSQGKKEKWAGTSEENNLAMYANYSEPGSSDKDGYENTAPVRSLTPNELGLYDMSGNVWEWCWDWKDTYPSGSTKNPKGPVSRTYRVIYRVFRGGSWFYHPSECRVASRSEDLPDYSYNFIGFRLSRGH